MTSTKRIILNFMATYGRSLYALVCGLFTGRWLLMALGETDYGLWGVVGGLTAFIVFFNEMLSTSVSRYYAYAVGENEGGRTDGLEECRQWFNLAVLVHTVVPVALVGLGYPLAEYAVRHWLTIPPERLGASVWVLRFSILSGFISMVSVPCRAMYIAKQYIAELTVYSFATTTLNAVVLYFMVTHQRDWLTTYAGWAAVLAIVPQVMIFVRALWIFPECRFNRHYLWNPWKLKALMAFSGYRFAGALAIMLQGQGMAILVNKMLCPARNAAMTVGNTLVGQSETLAAALFGALSPAITQAVGAGNMEQARTLSLRACRFGASMVLIFVIPLLTESDTVLRLWLKEPPEMASVLCGYTLLVLSLEKLSAGLYMIIFAVGRIIGYQFWLGVTGVLAVPLAYCLLASDLDLAGVGIALLVAKAVCVVIRLCFASKHGGISALGWLKSVFVPLFGISVLAICVGQVVRMVMAPTFLRICVTTIVTNVVFVPLIWAFVLDFHERMFIYGKVQILMRKLWRFG